MRVLVVEDEERLSQALCQILREQRYLTDRALNGNDGLHYALSGQYDVIVLDVMLPGLDGFEVARRARAGGVATPIIMLTARDELRSKVTGLDSGADDYMTKPFEPEELLARIRALSRRKGEVTLETMRFDDLTLSLADGDLRCAGKSVRLGFKELEVLKVLMSNPKAPVSKEELIMKVWGADSEAEDNNVEAYISFLRKKFFFLGSRVGVTTVRKLGYRLEAQTK